MLGRLGTEPRSTKSTSKCNSGTVQILCVGSSILGEVELPKRPVWDGRRRGRAAEFLASEEASDIAGSCLTVDGSWVAYGGR